MVYFAIIEVDDGFTIIEVKDDQSVEEIAVREGGILVDSGPYSSYEEACDALDQLEVEDDEIDAV